MLFPPARFSPLHPPFRIQTGTDATEGETIGIVSKWGFPVHYRATAPGLARAQFDVVRFWLNSIVWFVILMAVWTVVFRRCHKP